MTRESFSLPEKESKRRFREAVGDFDFTRHEETQGSSNEQISNELISTAEIFELEGVSLGEIHEWYAVAMSRRGREPLEADRFVDHFEGMSTDPTFAFGNKEKGYLLGYLKSGVFIPTHFAPKTMRGGYDLFKKLGDSTNIPAVVSITDDLKDTLIKMPSWHALDMSFLSSFRNVTVNKKIMYNSHPDTIKLMSGLASEYSEAAKNVI